MSMFVSDLCSLLQVADRHNYSTLVQLIDKEIEKREIEEHYAKEEREKEETWAGKWRR